MPIKSQKTAKKITVEITIEEELKDVGTEDEITNRKVLKVVSDGVDVTNIVSDAEGSRTFELYSDSMEDDCDGLTLFLVEDYI